MDVNCCPACRWVTKRTGCSNQPFDEAVTLMSPRDMVEGDVVLSMRKIDGLGRHALGRVLHTYKVLPPQRRVVAITQWEDEDEPRHVLSEGATGMLVMRREGADRGFPGTKHGVWGTVEYNDVPAPWEGLTA
jgi:hypothetical protein